MKIQHARKFLVGTREKRGIFQSVFLYLFLIGVGYVYLNPVIKMISASLMSSTDIVNPLIRLIPSGWYPGNFKIAWDVLNLSKSLPNSLWLSITLAIVQTIFSAFVGYGLARFNFPMKRFVIFLVLLTIVVSPAITMIPKYMLFEKFKLIGSYWPIILPTIGGQGVYGGIFILIFLQFFSMIPKALNEAAEIDGCGKLKVFLRIALPISVPAIIVSLIFSLVWNWNETFLTSLFLGAKAQTLPIKLSQFVNTYYQQNTMQWGSTNNRINDGIRLAGTLVSITPLIIFYILLQKQFIESIDTSGITGE